MLEHTTGDIFKDDADAIVNPVNCVGIMGAGLALQFKRRYPGNFKAYARACKLGEVEPGRPFVYETGMRVPRFIINFPTKQHWSERSTVAILDAGLDALVVIAKQFSLRSMAIPALGAGLGGLPWEKACRLIESAMGELPDVSIRLFAPRDTLPRNKGG